MSDCVFCRIVDGDEPAEVVYSDERTLGFMDHRPITPGHTLVIPRRHVETVWELPEDEAGPLMTAALRVAQLLRDGLEPDGLNLFQSNGVAAFQTVFHLHIHLLPRTSGDWELPSVVLEATYASREELASMAARIRG